MGCRRGLSDAQCRFVRYIIKDSTVACCAAMSPIVYTRGRSPSQSIIERLHKVDEVHCDLRRSVGQSRKTRSGAEESTDADSAGMSGTEE